MQLVQSYIFSVCRSSLSLYEQRIVLRIVEFAQTMLADVTMRDVVGSHLSVDDNVKVTLSLRDVMCDDKAKHFNCSSCCETRRIFLHIKANFSDKYLHMSDIIATFVA